MNQNIIVMLSGEGTTLQALLDTCEVAKVVGVISDNPVAGGIQRAMNANIPHIKALSSSCSRAEFDKYLTHMIDDIIKKVNGIRFIVLAGYMRILSPEFIEYFNSQKIEIINTHPSLLPKYRGLDTYQRVLDAGDEEHGFTVHKVTPELDGGPIVFQFSFVVTDAQDTPNKLEKKTREFERKYFPHVIDELISSIDTDSYTAIPYTV